MKYIKNAEIQPTLNPDKKMVFIAILKIAYAVC